VLTNNQVLIRPALMGDLNLDGFVNGDDIGVIISLGYYGTGNAPHGWLDGDLNYDVAVDGNDIGLIISTGTYNTGPYAAMLTHSSSASMTASSVISSSQPAAPSTSASSSGTRMQASAATVLGSEHFSGKSLYSSQISHEDLFVAKLTIHSAPAAGSQ